MSLKGRETFQQVQAYSSSAQIKIFAILFYFILSI